MPRVPPSHPGNRSPDPRRRFYGWWLRGGGVLVLLGVAATLARPSGAIDPPGRLAPAPACRAASPAEFACAGPSAEGTVRWTGSPRRHSYAALPWHPGQVTPAISAERD